jgi:hypothetical protein
MTTVMAIGSTVSWVVCVAFFVAIPVVLLAYHLTRRDEAPDSVVSLDMGDMLDAVEFDWPS